MGLPFEEPTELAHLLATIAVALNPDQRVPVPVAARVLGCSDNYVRKLIAAKRIASTERGRRRNVLLKDVLDVSLGDPEVEATKPNTTGLRNGKGARR